MSKKSVITVTGICLSLLLAAFVATPRDGAAQADVPAYVPDQVLVKLKAPEALIRPQQNLADRSESLGAKHGLEAAEAIPGTEIVVFEKPGAAVEQLVEALADDPAVEAAQPNYIYRIAAETLPWGIGSGIAQGDSGLTPIRWMWRQTATG
jgi:hypothetical protein